MKKLFVFLFALIIYRQAFAQNVGIGTSNPNTSAILDVNSSNKGVLLPRVFLQNSVDNSTVQSPAVNLIVFNTNPAITGGVGLFYNNNTVASPNWAKVGDLKFPYSGGTSTNNPAFYILNYGASGSAVGIKGYSEHGAGLQGISNNGTGVYAQSFNGNALEVDGALKISGTGQTPQQGKVLTSDANGNASWEGAIAFSSTGIQPGGAVEFSSNVEKKVPFYTEDYDYSNNYNPSSVSPYSTFTAPVKGIYHFDVKTTWDFDYSTGTSIMNLRTVYNGVINTVCTDYISITDAYAQHNINRDVQLEAGTQVYVTIRQTTGSTQSLIYYYLTEKFSYFTGRLVMKL